jgi:hypothetical protein
MSVGSMQRCSEWWVGPLARWRQKENDFLVLYQKTLEGPQTTNPTAHMEYSMTFIYWRFIIFSSESTPFQTIWHILLIGVAGWKVFKFSTFVSLRHPSWRDKMVGSSTSSRRNPFAENQQSTIWSNFCNCLFSQWKSRTCCIQRWQWRSRNKQKRPN